MDKTLNVIHFLCLLFFVFYPYHASSLPLCTDLRAPSTTKGTLSFCKYSGKSCCSPSEDFQLQQRFSAMNISDSTCASAVRSILCATCDPFSAEIFNSLTETTRPVPFLCNNSTSNFCSNVWRSCQNVPIANSPFAPSLQTKAMIPFNATISKLTDLWQTESDFCSAFGGQSNQTSLCFDGAHASPNKTTDAPPPPPPGGMCLEKLDDGAYLNMAAHPDGSNRAFFSSQSGKVWLASIPDQDSGQALGLDQSSPFVDLTDQVYLDSRFGMMGMAFHPNFATNGRFFASFNCDKEKSPACGGRCACNSDVNCDPSKLGPEDAGEHCKYHVVVAEYSVNGTSSSPSTAEKASPKEVRRILTLGLPFTENHGGQILFGPGDGYLYVMMGDGDSKGDPYNFSQNKKSLLGKIMRVDVDNVPSDEDIDKLGLWGNYSIPQDNPYAEDKDMEPEIWAYGLRNPWRCSFDADRPHYFLCADVGQDQYEEVNIITKGGNFGWSVYEGPLLFQPQNAPGRNPNASVMADAIFPVAGYSHSNLTLGSAAISGGYVYRGQADPCAYESYLYGDLYANHIWTASETPRNSGNFTSSDIPFSCAADSPIKCDVVPKTTMPALQYIFSFGEDNRRDVYVLTQSGVYRVVRPSRCGYSCSKEVLTPRNSPPRAESQGCLVKSNLLFTFAAVLALLL